MLLQKMLTEKINKAVENTDHVFKKPKNLKLNSELEGQ